MMGGCHHNWASSFLDFSNRHMQLVIVVVAMVVVVVKPLKKQCKHFTNKNYKAFKILNIMKKKNTL